MYVCVTNEISCSATQIRANSETDHKLLELHNGHRGELSGRRLRTEEEMVQTYMYVAGELVSW